MDTTDSSIPEPISFKDLNLPDSLLQALGDVGYETPSPIQAQTIPHLLAGLDLLGHAPTGTGKTAAFALPLLSRLDLAERNVQVLVLAPTRELAIQVAEAFQRYATHIKGFSVLPIYGGQPYAAQIRQLKRGVHVVVGTPGRVMDHMRKGTLNLNTLQGLVLDEADEMLRMGFLEDVEWILEQTPEARQIALFSATMPREVQRIARKHLKDPREIKIKARTATADTIHQRYWLVGKMHKLDALTRILEVESFDAMLLFVRTKTATTELADRLEARGFAAAAMNGDMVQKDREQMIERLKNGKLDILVATDVAARGLDVDRISHVVNYDIPYDTETYIHRIGRTGRAGRRGDAILFVAPRERRMLGAIEKATRQKIEPFTLPTTQMVNDHRIKKFKDSITQTLAEGDLEFMQDVLDQYQKEHDVLPIRIAAALAKMTVGERPLLLDERPENKRERAIPGAGSSAGPRQAGDAREKRTRGREANETPPESGMERFRIEVGHDHSVKPANIVGAIANEAGLDSEYIGQIDIRDSYSLVDLPEGMPREVFRDLKKAWVCGQKLNIIRLADADDEAPQKRPPPSGKKPRPARKKPGKGTSRKPGASAAAKRKPPTKPGAKKKTMATKPPGKSAGKSAGKPPGKSPRKSAKKKPGA